MDIVDYMSTCLLLRLKIKEEKLVGLGLEVLTSHEAEVIFFHILVTLRAKMLVAKVKVLHL
jgi:hypothetical protein